MLYDYRVQSTEPRRITKSKIKEIRKEKKKKNDAPDVRKIRISTRVVFQPERDTGRRKSRPLRAVARGVFFFFCMLKQPPSVVFEVEIY